ncbi:hypothetical protein [Rubellimicrobium roseum]|uniref:Sulfotransferase family protein n=1 Tax=Rubellimicrobium roseum TaxID=687525 RepID=A0A5C4NBR8_9RHOB|nr:hypothetical protein [Rubellimicrobium roseum]TNC71482.1 hypothetical protein FHG71_11055 [Rubellimicrobium roseum]
MAHDLNGNGVDVLVPQLGLRDANLLRPYSLRRPATWLLPGARNLTGRISHLRQGHPVALLSEENLLGPPGNVIRGNFYKNSLLLKILGDLARRTPTTLYLSVRSPATFLPSIYAESLRHEAAPAGGFDNVIRWVSRRAPRWSGLVSDLKAAAPSARLVIWRYEDFRNNDAAILSELCGIKVALPAEPADTLRTQSGSANAVRLAERLGPEMEADERRRRVHEIYTDPGSAGPPFRPFPPDLIKSLELSYELDLHEIRRISPGSLMEFGGPRATYAA